MAPNVLSQRQMSMQNRECILSQCTFAVYKLYNETKCNAITECNFTYLVDISCSFKTILLWSGTKENVLSFPFRLVTPSLAREIDEFSFFFLQNLNISSGIIVLDVMWAYSMHCEEYMGVRLLEVRCNGILHRLHKLLFHLREAHITRCHCKDDVPPPLPHSNTPPTRPPSLCSTTPLHGHHPTPTPPLPPSSPAASPSILRLTNDRRRHLRCTLTGGISGRGSDWPVPWWLE